MLPGIVLAAGDSIRMGSPKALLPSPDGRPFVTRIVETLHEAGIVELVVVTGRDHDALVKVLSHGVRVPPLIARNIDPSRGQLSSLWVGMDAVVRADTEGILVTLVDVPMVAVSTVTRVVTAWQRTRAPIVRPAIGDRHGHPVIFDQISVGRAARALRSMPARRPSCVRTSATCSTCQWTTKAASSMSIRLTSTQSYGTHTNRDLIVSAPGLRGSRQLYFIAFRRSCRAENVSESVVVLVALEGRRSDADRP